MKATTAFKSTFISLLFCIPAIPVFAKIRLYLKILASCVIVTCLFLIIIHPEAWITPSCIIVAMICLLFLLIRAKRKESKK